MLVLTRKSNQSIMIGDEIEVSVLAIMGEKVRIGIQAPRTIPVFRKEVYLEIQQERGEDPQAKQAVDAALDELKRLGPSRRLAGYAGERLEHHDRHDDGREDDHRTSMKKRSVPCFWTRSARRTRARWAPSP